MPRKAETSLQTAVATYLRLQYPDIIFTSEASGIRVPIGIAKQMKAHRSEAGLPDMIILEPRGGYHGLCLELKQEGTVVRTAKGEYYATVRHQGELLDRLAARGYRAEFAVGFDAARRLIDGYMATPQQPS
jgi:hypothetical protein